MAIDARPVPVAGAYVVQWGTPAVVIGQTDDGFIIRVEPEFEEITSDAGGDSVLDLLGRGGQCFVDFEWLEYSKAKLSKILFKHMQIAGGAAAGLPDDPIGNIGKSIYDTWAAPLILTPLANSGNATALGNTYTFTKAYPVDVASWNLNTRLRRGSLTFRALPVPGSTIGAPWFIAT